MARRSNEKARAARSKAPTPVEERSQTADQAHTKDGEKNTGNDPSIRKYLTAEETDRLCTLVGASPERRDTFAEHVEDALNAYRGYLLSAKWATAAVRTRISEVQTAATALAAMSGPGSQSRGLLLRLFGLTSEEEQNLFTRQQQRTRKSAQQLSDESSDRVAGELLRAILNSTGKLGDPVESIRLVKTAIQVLQIIAYAAEGGLQERSRKGRRTNQLAVRYAARLVYAYRFATGKPPGRGSRTKFYRFARECFRLAGHDGDPLQYILAATPPPEVPGKRGKTY